MKKYGFGVDIGGTTCKIGLFETSGKMLDKWEIPTNKADNGGHILDDVAASIDEKMKSASIAKEDVEGIGNLNLSPSEIYTYGNRAIF